MPKIPAIAEKRLKAEIPKFQKIISSAASRDINEADTVVIITDMLERIFGFDKYENITREFAIKGTYVDLAVVYKNKIDYLIEVKAIGISLKESHLRQAVDYAAKEGVKWAILTNGIEWQIHKVSVDGQVTNEKVIEFNFLEISSRNAGDLEKLFLLCKRGIDKDLIDDYYKQKQVFNRFTVGAIILNEDVTRAIKRVLKRINPGLKIDDDELKQKIIENVLKREIIDSESGKEAQKAVNRELKKIEKKKQKESASKKE